MLSTVPSFVKSQAYVNGGVPVDELVNWTSRGAFPDNGVPVNEATGATGAGFTVIYPVLISLSDPAEFETVRFTV